jgi:hypothetical protein
LRSQSSGTLAIADLRSYDCKIDKNIRHASLYGSADKGLSLDKQLARAVEVPGQRDGGR